MKQIIGKYLLAGGLLLAIPQMLLAQKPAKAAKPRKEVQQIIITRNDDGNEKTVIEINGDRVVVNGKDVKELKDANIEVDINRLKDVEAFVGPRGARPPHPPRAMAAPRVWHGDDSDAFSFFEEDSSRAMLGVVTAEDEKGARINEVSKESGAEKAGLKKGDIITRINDAKVEDAGDVSEQVRKHKPGDKITVSILRDGKEQKIVAELTRWKGLGANGRNFRIMMPDRVVPFGRNDRMELRDFNFEFNGEDRPRLGVSVQDSEDGNGVVVQDVDEESNAAKAGIKEDDVITHFNDVAIKDVGDMRRELTANKDKISAKIKLLRNGKEQTLDVKMPRKLRSADL